ncbi:hypothetical protein EXIGLDRAFT_759084 [Exidia glandulosa HHB12029]|uniref:Uncharacterized protein n=1 Tax=Exidia glandulosa HHB12029 TaxID=1314781 RepID=A0A165Q7L3_EXIGL|nr:hypothetical protein EXIGLDRAFT_759084 [Exidia glandulosa HHB12029]
MPPHPIWPKRTLWGTIRHYWFHYVRLPWGDVVAQFVRLEICPHPWRLAMTLLWPIPWHLPLEPHPSVAELLADPDYIERRKETDVNYTLLRQLWPFIWRDTPLRTLYRIYDCVVTNDDNEMMEEGHYWFHIQPHWRVHDIPDPKDPDPQRYALLAAIAESLASAFNRKIKLGLRRGIHQFHKPWLIGSFHDDPNPPYESAPPWTASVGPVEETLCLVPPRPVVPTNPFHKRNMFAGVQQLGNI